MPTQNVPVIRRYYPTLSSIISEDDVPEILGFIREGIQNLFNKIHFKDLQYSKSPRGDAAFYSLSIVSPDRVDIEIPGTGIYLVLNPDFTGGDFNISSFPITIEYQWKILAYLREFSVGNFSFAPQEIFEIALRVLNISEEQALANFINTFVTPANGNTTPLQQFVADINTNNSGWASPLPTPTESTKLADIATHIYQQSGKYGSLVAFESFIMENDMAETSLKVKTYFKLFIPGNIEDYIKDIIIPKFRATLMLSAAIEFPRSILKPVYDEFGINPYQPDPDDPPVPQPENALTVIPADAQGNPKVLLSFGEAVFYADSAKGFGYNMDIVLNTISPAQIGNTGLIIDIHNLRIDLSRTENIAEADFYNQPTDFMGAYIEHADIFLPKKWFKKQTGQTLAIFADRLLVGTGGISGTIGLRATYATYALNQITNYFQDYFQIQFPISVFSNGSEVEITSYTELLAHINSLDKPALLKFKYPFSVTVPQTGNTIIFSSENQYNTFISAIDPGQFMWFNLGSNENTSWRIGFKNFDITFQQGQVVESHLHAQLEVKKFKRNDEVVLIDLYGEWKSEEEFRLTASFLPDGLPLNLFNLLIVTFQGVELGRNEGDFFIGADTKISFPEDSLAYSLFNGQEIDIPALRFYFDGRFEIVGGNSFIPVNFTLPIGPIEMSVTGIHIGSIQREHNGRMRKYNYIGFDGGMSLDPIGIDIRGRGVKYYYTIDNDENPANTSDSYFHISTLELDLVIPGTASPTSAIAIIKGALTIPEPGVSTEFSGQVSVQMPQPKIFGQATMKLDPTYPSFLVDAGVEFPVPIPLGPIGIFGFKGLLGYRYVAEKKAIGMDEDNTWYEYYMAPQKGINYLKFSGPEETADYNSAFSVGIGASIATMDGGGRTASLRAMMLLSLNSMFAIDAGLTILSERLGLAETDNRTPPFYALIIVGDNSLEFGAGANFSLNKSNGWFLEIQAQLQAGFFFNNQQPWYINFGDHHNRIEATLFKDVLSLRAMSYLMLSASGIEAGASVDFSLDLFIAKLHCSLEVGGYISFERPQVGGYIRARGMIHISFFIFNFNGTLDAYFSVEIPKPFLIYAELRFRLCAGIRLGPIRATVCVTLVLGLKWEKNNTVDYSPIAPLTYTAIQDPDYSKIIQTSNFVKGVHMMTFETFNLKYLGVNISEPNPEDITAILPLDTYIDIKVEKGLDPSSVSTKIGGHTSGANNFVDLIPPRLQQPGNFTLRQVKHKYTIESIEIRAWSTEGGGHWVNYHPFKAILPNEDVDHLKIGFWQKNSNSGLYDTIRLLATNSFSFLDGAESGWFIPEQYGITPSALFCTSIEDTLQCINVLNKLLGTVYNPPTQYYGHYINGIYCNIKGFFAENMYQGDIDQNQESILSNAMVITNTANPHNFAKSLTFNNYNTLVLTLPEPAVKIELKLSTSSGGVTIKYFRTGINGNSMFQSFDLIGQVYKTAAELSESIVYDNTLDYDGLANVYKIEIIPDYPNSLEIYNIQEQILEITIAAAESAEGPGSNLSPEEAALLDSLNEQLNILQSIGCSQTDTPPCIIDEILCAFYTELKNMYDQCFDIYPAKDIFMYCNELECFYDFKRVIEQFHVDNPQYDIINVLQPYLQYYSSNLTQLDGWCGGSMSNTEMAYKLYNEFLEHTQAILYIVGELGNCNCSDSPITVCNTSFQSLCWETLSSYEYSLTVPSQAAVEADTEAMIQGMQATAQPVWRPNTKYYIKFSLKDEVANGLVSPGIFDYYYGFRTVGPIGHFHKYPNAYNLPEGASVDEYPITSLGKYIDYNRSYPNADGNLLMSKPIFYGHDQCKISIFFAKAFAYHMLNKWEDYNTLPAIEVGMHIAIKDPVSDVIIPYPLPQDWETIESVPETVGNGENGIAWVDDNDPLIPANIQMLNNFINYVNANSDAIHCEIDLGDPIRPAAYTYSVTVSNLKPRKLYTALIYNAFDEDGNGIIANQVHPDGSIKYDESQLIHQFVFQTSRYHSFREQVESYILKEFDDNGIIINQKQAVYNLRIPLTLTQINDAYALISGVPNGQTNALELQFYHEFDRVIEGVLGLSPLDPPVTTDFIKIINELSDDVAAVLVRNPEPFNNPKIPLAIIQDTLKVISGMPSQYSLLWSKDYSQALIMHSSKKIVSNLELEFSYKVWNGSNYVVPNIDPITGAVIDPLKDTGIVVVDSIII